MEKKQTKIKNYTTQVSSERTISLIEQELVKLGISHIEKEYSNGKPTGIIFSIILTQKISFKIPAKIDAAFEIIKVIPEYKSKQKDWIKEQAARTAWRIIYNWIQLQVAMVQLDQAEAMQVFLPYIYNPDKKETIFDKLKSTNYKYLTD